MRWLRLRPSWKKRAITSVSPGRSLASSSSRAGQLTVPQQLTVPRVDDASNLFLEYAVAPGVGEGVKSNAWLDIQVLAECQTLVVAVGSVHL